MPSIIDRLILRFMKASGIGMGPGEGEFFRHSFASFLPYDAYDSESGAYLCQDDTLGYIWEGSPVVTFTEESQPAMQALCQALPLSGVLQFIACFDSKPKEDSAELQERRSRLLIAWKSAEDAQESDFIESVKVIEDALGKIGFTSLKSVKPGDLVPFLYDLFNAKTENEAAYSPERLIREQVILSETVIDSDNKDFFVSGDKNFFFLTPKICPSGVNIEALKEIETGFIAAQNFIVTVKPIPESEEPEYDEAGNKQVERKMFRFLPVFQVFSDTPEKAAGSMARAKTIFKQQGILMQEDKSILAVLFLFSLPLGVYNVEESINNLERDFLIRTENIGNFMPAMGISAQQITPEGV